MFVLYFDVDKNAISSTFQIIYFQLHLFFPEERIRNSIRIETAFCVFICLFFNYSLKKQTRVVRLCDAFSTFVEKNKKKKMLFVATP